MLHDEQKRDLIERHIDGLLTAKEQQEYDQLLREDENFVQAVKFHEKFMNSMNRLGDELFLSNLRKLEQQIQAERTLENKTINALKDLTDNVLKKGGELLDDVIAAFLPIPQYEVILASASRSSTFEVVRPENGIDCGEEVLEFELKKAIDQSLQLSIEDNQQKILKEKTIGKQVARFEVSVKNLNPGRYYWKLKTDEDLVMGSFFVRKDLMNS